MQKILIELKPVLEVVSQVITIMVAIAGIAYFWFQIGFQKTLQRLSGDIKAKLLGTKDGLPYVEFECLITNKAPVRIDLDEVDLQVVEPYNQRIHLPINMEKGENTRADEDLDDGLIANPYARKERIRAPRYSVDGDSTIRLTATATLKGEAEWISVEFRFVPRLTKDRYVLRRAFHRCEVNGVKSFV
jgi:hypothetical protein